MPAACAGRSEPGGSRHLDHRRVRRVWRGQLLPRDGLKAKAEGWLGEIDGVHVQCPSICNEPSQEMPDLPSLSENDGFFLSVRLIDAMTKAYDPHGANAANPLCWPDVAERSNQIGLPRT